MKESWIDTKPPPSEQAERDKAHSRLLVGRLLRRMLSEPENPGSWLSEVTPFMSHERAKAIRIADAQALQQHASRRMASIVAICDSNECLHNLRFFLAPLRDDLQAGGPRDLHDLLPVPGMSPAKAKALSRAGVQTARKLARASEERIAKALLRGGPSKGMGIGQDMASRWAIELKRAAKQMTQKAEHTSEAYCSHAFTSSRSDQPTAPYQPHHKEEEHLANKSISSEREPLAQRSTNIP